MKKALLLLERYQGNSPQLPAHVGVDDTVYGSLAIYQKEILRELQFFVKVNSIEELDKVMMQAISSASEEQQEDFKGTWATIKMLLS